MGCVGLVRGGEDDDRKRSVTREKRMNETAHENEEKGKEVKIN